MGEDGRRPSGATTFEYAIMMVIVLVTVGTIVIALFGAPGTDPGAASLAASAGG